MGGDTRDNDGNGLKLLRGSGFLVSELRRRS